jgi:hypothetical protein
MEHLEPRKRIRKIKKLIEVPYNNLFITSLILVIAFLFVELIARIYNLYEYWPVIDVPSHFFAGMAATCIFFWIVSLSNVKRKRTTAVSLTLVVAGIWELLEMLEEKITPFTVPPFLRDYFFWDGFWDIIVTVMGGILIFLILKLLKSETKLYDHNLEV